MYASLMQRSFRGEVLPLRMLHMEHIAVASTCVQWQCCLVEVEPDRIIAPISHCLQKGRPCEEEADLKKRRKKPKVVQSCAQIWSSFWNGFWERSIKTLICAGQKLNTNVVHFWALVWTRNGFVLFFFWAAKWNIGWPSVVLRLEAKGSGQVVCATPRSTVSGKRATICDHSVGVVFAANARSIRPM